MKGRPSGSRTGKRPGAAAAYAPSCRAPRGGKKGHDQAVVSFFSSGHSFPAQAVQPLQPGWSWLHSFSAVGFQLSA